MVSIVFHGHGDMENEEFMGLRFQGEQSRALLIRNTLIGEIVPQVSLITGPTLW